MPPWRCSPRDRQVARWPVRASTPPFAAGLVGAALGGLAIRLGWTDTLRTPPDRSCADARARPPSINGVHDMLENHMQTGICRLGLAVAILTAAALGVVLGGWLTLGLTELSTAPPRSDGSTLPLDAVLAGVAACGFGAFDHGTGRVLWVSIALRHGRSRAPLSVPGFPGRGNFHPVRVPGHRPHCRRSRRSHAASVFGRRVCRRRPDDAGVFSCTRALRAPMRLSAGGGRGRSSGRGGNAGPSPTAPLFVVAAPW